LIPEHKKPALENLDLAWRGTGVLTNIKVWLGGRWYLEPDSYPMVPYHAKAFT
jgi:hypothetical protein